MERPALKRMMADIEAGKIDVVVIYKIDRLTRSLADFSKMVEVFERYGVSFVSVTQQFNTTTSMGRLMLNILLSFAQFEREVTGERIRDKIAASKRKGMWMGGVPPLGYDVENRRLVPNEREAKLIRHIFQRFVELGSSTDAGQGAETGRRDVEGVDHAGRQDPRWQADRQGPDLQAAQQPDLPRRVAPQGAVVPGRAPAHHRAANCGTASTRSWPPMAGCAATRRGPTVPYPAQGHRVRQRRSRTVAVAHDQEERPPLPLLRAQRDAKEHAGASGLPRLPAAELESAVLDQLRAILRAPADLGSGSSLTVSLSIVPVNLNGES
jgi:site-specific DNA recombinase